MNTTDAPNSAHTTTLGPVLTAGFGSTLAMWIVGWLTHLPGLATSTPFALFLLCAVLVVTLTAFARLAPSPLRAGLIGGGVAGILNLLILGSVLSVQAEDTTQMADAANQFRDNAPFIVLGYIALTLAAGAIAGLIATFTRSRQPATDPGVWLARFSVITTLTFFPLILVGGAVTGTESGMSIPDGVTSYGAFSAMLPMSIMAEPRIFLEHTHRLFGTLVGLTAIALMLFTLAREKRLAPRIFSVILLGLVIAQGVFGAIRVGASVGALAAVHGVFAQLVLSFAVVTACKLSSLDRHPPLTFDPKTTATSKRAERLTHFSAWAVLIQLIFGALARHTQGGSHALWTHVGFSIVVVAMVVVSAATLGTADHESPTGRLLRRIGRLLMATVFVQFVLGGLTLWQVSVAGDTRPIPTADQLAAAHDIDVLEALITTAHQTVGATLLAFIAISVYWSK
ncbi:MAG: COX15/CtaA family protein, partial [Phycisphaerales bacterium]|nr:COX15/CtaA family protein [Phycisphaerales bacterium]